jgi:methylenetetrahydrofolate reductase (NADPH)
VRIVDRLRDSAEGKAPPCFSFEFFPPRSAGAEANLFEVLHELQPLKPGFVSVTYGAGGSTREKTVEIVTRIKKETGIEAMAHFTCVGHSRDEIRDTLARVRDAGVENVIALRGDPPKGQAKFEVPQGGFGHANELVEFIRAEKFPFCLGGAAYPEGHVESDSKDADLAHLKRKVAAGVDFLVTQMFYDNAFYFDFVERARKAGIRVPIVPGLMPITTFEQIERITRMCGATIPRRLQLELERIHDDPVAVSQLGIAHATVQAKELLDRGVPAVHFYTLNRSSATRMIVSALQV